MILRFKRCIQSLQTLDMAILAHSGIYCLVSLSLSSLIINSGVSTRMAGKSTIFFTFHTSSVTFIVFVDSSKYSTVTDCQSHFFSRTH